MDLTDGYSISFPLFFAEKTPNFAFKLSGEIRGTCFSIGGNYMLTAGHVVSGFSCTGDYCAVVGLLNPSSGYFKGALLTDFEVFPHDLGLLRVEFTAPESVSWFHVLKWVENQINPFDVVRCLGFAYGMHSVEDNKTCVQRAFQGHIVSNLLRFKPIGSKEAPFSVYEVSFSAPRGLSGAPLLNAHGTLAIHGVVIGNSESRMLVFKSEERETNRDGLATVEQYETLTLGIAVRADQVLQLHSQMLGKTIGEHLRGNDLII